MTTLRFEFDYTQFVGPDGQAVAELPAIANDREILVRLYRSMVLTRTFDAKAVALQRTGRLGTYPSSLGQEAVTVGVGDATQPSDVFLGTYREHGAQIERGVTLQEMLLFWGGDERGTNYAGPREDFPPCIPIGSHAPHAVGVALAMRLRGEARAAVCVMGDGATSKGDVYEAMNAAGVWALPVLFVVNNNQWAISVSRAQQTASKTLAQKAIACGFNGEQVDGNDVIAVRQVVDEALARMRNGDGPHLIEAITYRMTDHTTADDAGRYRDEHEVSEHWKEDPIKRLRIFLTENHGWSRNEEEDLISGCQDAVDVGVAAYLETAAQDPESMFDYLYETLPEALASQRSALSVRRNSDG